MICFCREGFEREFCTYLLLWLGSSLYRPLAATVVTVAGAGLYPFPSMVICFGATTVFSYVLLGFVHAYYRVCLVLCNDEICFGMSSHCSGAVTVVGIVVGAVAWYRISSESERIL